ncbi:DUF6448 family protein [Sunxiuqinia dokdonensis]|uniref:Uncharacterized protein n=1 Tax=Sunxiuqinia dokdonensis TaxID=1409788 RepID=A0A0L8VFA6_9BACT|nr:DUF6448 family protein [Sunxiuqinia dokdonensis]KOH47129.1 hypothetical protein NC99_00640 [Sunxiuqinia dokdonensis]|tara:strand:+ start:191 stop:838 length:648 start_codon:yes stop_codon:yes gene_type:complete
MRTKETNLVTTSPKTLQNRKTYKTIFSIVLLFLFMIFGTLPVSAHCDSYDGPTIKDAIKALETNNVNLVLKWITPEQEKEIIPLFNKTYSLKKGDKEVYAIVEKHFFETLVRLHRVTEGAPFTGLKPAETTKMIVQLSDKALESNNIDDFLVKLNTHIGKVIKDKYDKVVALEKVKNDSPEKGREYVEAYVDYTHTIEAIHDIAEQGGGHSAHKH